jgi:hypothetical protein
MMDRRREEVSAAEALLLADCEDSLLSLRAAATPSLDSYAGLESLAEQALQEGDGSSSHNNNNNNSRLPIPNRAAAAKVPPLLAEEVQSHPAAAGSGAVPSHNGLDALATLASEERQGSSRHAAEAVQAWRATGVTSASSSSEDEEEKDDSIMPPPRRRRAASNPEGMEKWDSLLQGRHSSRRHFVLPESILEEELAEASAAVRERELQRSSSTEEAPEEQDAEAEAAEDMAGTEEEEESDETKAAPEEEEEVDESMLTPDELLRKARSRLLEDLSEGSIHGEKGEVLLPHALGKYKQVGGRIAEKCCASGGACRMLILNHVLACSRRVLYVQVYNQNGRIGIYTPSEREAIIARFNAKRQRRVWNKKIRYNCRKSLADRRLRVKGRFVKRSEQEALARELQARVEKVTEEEAAVLPLAEADADEDMPDVNDPEAGFAPTEDQPYRRFRRYTIT